MNTSKDKPQRIAPGAPKATATAPKVTEAEAKHRAGRTAKAVAEERAVEEAHLKGRLKDTLASEAVLRFAPAFLNR